MGTKTPNYDLNKPAQTDFYDVNVQNENMDLIDAALKGKVDKVTGKGLSTNDYNNTDKGKVNNLPGDTNTELDEKTNNTDFQNHTDNTTVHITSSERTAWNGKPTTANVDTKISTHNSASSAHSTLFNQKAAAADLTSHTDNTTVHVTSSERTAWNGKVDKASGTLAFTLGRDNNGIYVEF